MIVVSDASPLISLAAVQQLELLRHLYSEVLIPEAVHREVTAAGPAAQGAADMMAATWIHVRSVQDRSLAEALSLLLDLGEAEAIVLAVENAADLLLVDERRARQTAARLGQRVVGVLGVLIEAKQQGFLPKVRPVLEALTAQAGFRVSPALYASVLKAAGE